MTKRGEACLETLKITKLICVIRSKGTESFTSVMQALYKNRIKIIERTASIPCFYRQIRSIHEAFSSKPDCFIRAETILTETVCSLTKNAGADFLVSPVFNLT